MQFNEDDFVGRPQKRATKHMHVDIIIIVGIIRVSVILVLIVALLMTIIIQQ